MFKLLWNIKANFYPEGFDIQDGYQMAYLPAIHCNSLKTTLLTTYAPILVRFLKNILIRTSNDIHSGLVLADAHLKFSPRDAV